MKIENTKQLQKLINLCHKNNILSIEVDGIKLELGSKPEKVFRASASVSIPNVSVKEYAENVATKELTSEQLLYYSSGAGQ